MRLVAMAALLSLVWGHACAQDRWAAQSSNSESNAPVAWSDTQEGAIEKALAACRRISTTCGNRPASTDAMNYTFLTMCCTAPKPGCVIVPDGSVIAAERRAREIFAIAGYTSCGVTRRTSAGTGR